MRLLSMGMLILFLFMHVFTISCGDSSKTENSNIKCDDFNKQLRMDSRYKRSIDNYANMEYDDAISLLEELLVVAKLNDEPFQVIMLNLDLGLNWIKLEDFQKAFEYFNEAKRLNSTVNNTRFKALIYEYFGKYYFAKENYKKALLNYSKAYDIYNHCDRLGKMAICLHHKGLTNYKLNQLNEAIINLTSAAKINTMIKKEVPKAGNFFLIGKMYFEQKNYKKANNFIKEAYYIDKKYLRHVQVGVDLRLMGDIEWTSGKKKSAVNYYERMFDLFKVIKRSPKKMSEFNYFIDKNMQEVVDILLKYYTKTKCTERMEYYENEFGNINSRVSEMEKRRKRTKKHKSKSQ